jgi:hypothetical protein
MLDRWKREGPPINLSAGQGGGFAWFPKRVDALNDVSNMAEKEDWSKIARHGVEQTGQLDSYFNYLWRFIATTYKSQVEQRIMLLLFSTHPPSQKGGPAKHGAFAVFDTGLLTRDSKESIYALFSRNRSRADPPYVFKQW